MVNIYVGNLAYATTDADLQETFEQYGQVDRVSVITDRMTGRSKGFGFVEMPNEAEARAAISGLNDTDLKGRNIQVNEAQPRAERPMRSGNGGGGGGGGGRGGRGGGGGGRGGW